MFLSSMLLNAGAWFLLTKLRTNEIGKVDRIRRMLRNSQDNYDGGSIFGSGIHTPKLYHLNQWSRISELNCHH